MTWGGIYPSQDLEDAKKLAAEGMKPEAQGLCEVLQKDPFRNAPAFQELAGDLAGACSRRINISHWLVCAVSNKERTVRVLRMWTHCERNPSKSPRISQPARSRIGRRGLEPWFRARRTQGHFSGIIPHTAAAEVLPVDTNCLSVELPESLRGYVKERVARGEFADEGEYLRDLIRRDREGHAGQRLRELIQEGLDSGPARPMTEADWADLRARATQSVA